MRTLGVLLLVSVVAPIAWGFFGAMFADIRQWMENRP